MPTQAALSQQTPLTIQYKCGCPQFIHKENDLPAQSKEQQEIITKYHFSMSKATFDKIKPLFKLNRKSLRLETFYDNSQSSLMKSNEWLKLVQIKKFGFVKTIEEYISFKKPYEDVQPGVLRYRETRIPIEEAKRDERIANLLENGTKYSWTLEREEYRHLQEDDVVLTRDQVFFNNERESFVVFSLVGRFTDAENEFQIIENHLKFILSISNMDGFYFCRSKIVELLKRTNEELYQELVNRKIVPQLDYKSMCIAEYEHGELIAKERKKLAEEEVEKCREENKYLKDEDKYSELFMNCLYTSTAIHGIIPYNEEEDEFI